VTQQRFSPGSQAGLEQIRRDGVDEPAEQGNGSSDKPDRFDDRPLRV
jgi:hypothetical protein